MFLNSPHLVIFRQYISTTNYYEEKIDELFCKNHYCLIHKIYSFCWRKKTYTHLCRLGLKIYGSQQQL